MVYTLVLDPGQCLSKCSRGETRRISTTAARAKHKVVQWVQSVYHVVYGGPTLAGSLQYKNRLVGFRDSWWIGRVKPRAKRSHFPIFNVAIRVTVIRAIWLSIRAARKWRVFFLSVSSNLDRMGWRLRVELRFNTCPLQIKFTALSVHPVRPSLASLKKKGIAGRVRSGHTITGEEEQEQAQGKPILTLKSLILTWKKRFWVSFPNF